MPRRGSVPKRDVLTDPLYNSKLVTKLINNKKTDLIQGFLSKKGSVFDAVLKLDENSNIVFDFNEPNS